MTPAATMPAALGPQPRAGRPRASRWWRLIAVAVAVPLVAAACGDDDEAAGQEQANSTTSMSTSTTSSTQPPGTDPAAVEPIVEDLLARLDEITDEIVRDPSVVLDPDAPVLEELTEVQAPGEAYDARMRTYRENAESGFRLEPVNAARTRTTTLVGDLSTVDEGTVEGPVCILNTYRALDGNGHLREIKDDLAHPGRVTAVRRGGVWKIQQIDVDDTQVCDPGAVA